MVLFCVCFCPFWSLSDVKLWTAVVWQEPGENSTKILFKVHTGFEGLKGQQIMTQFSFFGWTVPLTLNAISSAGNLSSRIYRDEFSSLVSSNCSLQGGTSDGLWSLFLPSLVSKTVSNFTVSSLRSGRLCDLCHIILLFFPSLSSSCSICSCCGEGDTADDGCVYTGRTFPRLHSVKPSQLHSLHGNPILIFLPFEGLVH